MINITQKATDRVKEVLMEQYRVQEITPDINFYFRISIQGGGCSGFQYIFNIDEQIENDDTVILFDNVKTVVDSISLQYLIGSTVDFSDELFNSKFIVDNPNAKNTCGCASSFSI